MDTASNIPLCPPNEQGENQLVEFIRRYSEYLGDHKSNVDLGSSMLEMGTKTEFVQRLEQILVNPMEGMLHIKNGVDKEVLNVVDKLFKLFISKAKSDNLIDAAFKRKTGEYSLKYGIVLKEDNFEKRNRIFSFLHFYYTLEFAEKIPVYFQFIPEELIERIDNKEYIA